MVPIQKNWKVGNIKDIDINKLSVTINFLDNSILIKQTKKIKEKSNILEINNNNISFKNKQSITKYIEEIHRLSLIATNKYKNSSRTAIFLLMNPSQAIKNGCKNQSDITVNNCLKFAEENNYTKAIILNCSPFYASNGIDGDVINHLKHGCSVCVPGNLEYIELLLNSLKSSSNEFKIFIGTGELNKELKKLYIDIMNKFCEKGCNEFYCSLNKDKSLNNSGFAVHPGGRSKGQFGLTEKHKYKWDCNQNKLKK